MVQPFPGIWLVGSIASVLSLSVLRAAPHQTNGTSTYVFDAIPPNIVFGTNERPMSLDMLDNML